MSRTAKMVTGTIVVLVLAALLALLWPDPPAAPHPSAPPRPEAPAALRARAAQAARPEEPAVDRISPRRLRGRVEDTASGAPIAGARVTVLAFARDADLVGVQTTSDADGGFALDVPEGRVLVHAELSGWFQPGYPETADAVELWRRGAAHADRLAVDVPATGVATTILRLARSGRVEGRVVREDGGPVAAAAVVVHALGGGVRATTGVSDADGRFRLDDVAAARNLVAEATAPGLVTTERVALDLVSDGAVTGVEIRMRRPPIVRGRLVSASGVPLQGAAVQVVVVVDSRLFQSGPEGEWIVWKNAERTQASAGGAYEVPIWPLRGEFVVRATCRGHAPVRSNPVALVPGREVYEVDLTLPAGTSLCGRVTARDTGAGLASAIVLAAPATRPLAKVVAPLRATCDADGRFRFDGLSTETYSVSASADGFVEQRHDVTTPADGLAFDLEPALAISGSVQFDGAPLAGAVVGVQPQDDGGLPLFDPYVDPFAATARTSEDGTFRVGGLAAGRYRVSVRPGDAKHFRATLSSVVAAGTEGVIVHVPPLAAGEASDALACITDHDLGCRAAGENLAREYERSILLWESLLARPLTPNQRAAALIEYASPLGNSGRHEDQERALREALELAGADTLRGREAQSRLAWRSYWAGDPARALREIEPVMHSTDAVQAAGARWSAAKFAARSGDPDRARTLLTELDTELRTTSDSLLTRLLPQVRRSLDELDAR